jgi:hypothetical protein
MRVAFERMEDLPIGVIIGCYLVFFPFITLMFERTATVKDRTCMYMVVHHFTGVLIIAQLAVLSMFFFAQLPTARQIHLW